MSARAGRVRIIFASVDYAEPHVAFSIGKKVGGAVVRNRVRRRLRSICAEHSSAFSPGAYLISTSPEVANMTYGELKTNVQTALDLLHKGQPR